MQLFSVRFVAELTENGNKVTIFKFNGIFVI